ncbi:MAG: hypothetical protein ACI85V_000483, partial [bacterium]
TQARPILATERTAARLLDMPTSEFSALVSQGALPKAGLFGRWNVDDLQRIASGKAALDDGGLDL